VGLIEGEREGMEEGSGVRERVVVVERERESESGFW